MVRKGIRNGLLGLVPVPLVLREIWPDQCRFEVRFKGRSGNEDGDLGRVLLDLRLGRVR